MPEKQIRFFSLVQYIIYSIENRHVDLVCEARVLNEEECIALKKYRVKTIPATGGMAKDLPESGQLSLL